MRSGFQRNINIPDGRDIIQRRLVAKHVIFINSHYFCVGIDVIDQGRMSGQDALWRARRSGCVDHIKRIVWLLLLPDLVHLCKIVLAHFRPQKIFQKRDLWTLQFTIQQVFCQFPEFFRNDEHFRIQIRKNLLQTRDRCGRIQRRIKTAGSNCA